MDVQMQDATSAPSTSVLPQTTPFQANTVLGTPKASVAPSIPASAPVQIDAAKLEAMRKATLNSYKNKFLNLRDKFDKVNTVCSISPNLSNYSMGRSGTLLTLVGFQTNTDYKATLANAKKKEETIQDEIKYAPWFRTGLTGASLTHLRVACYLTISQSMPLLILKLRDVSRVHRRYPLSCLHLPEGVWE